MKSNFISKKNTNIILEKIFSQWKIKLPKIKNLKAQYINNISVFSTNDFCVVKINDMFLPSLSSTDILKQFPYVVIDMQAIKFICNGANIMRPGIRNYTKFFNDQIVCVVEESKHKFLAVGNSVMASDKIKQVTNGIIVKNLHYVGDMIWDAIKK